MNGAISSLWVAVLLVALVLTACKNKPEEASNTTLESAREVHPRETHGEGEGEEAGIQLSMDGVYDEVRKGSHLVLSYDAEAGAFVGSVKNVSDKVLNRVRVEVHLSNGSELGPSTQVDLQPGEKRMVILNAGDKSFKTWSAHTEVGSGEHNHEGAHEHSHEDKHEHSHEGDHEHSHEGEHSHEHN